MEDLQTLRQQIDRLDNELIVLLARRFEVTEKVGHLKAAQNMPIVDPAREVAQAEKIAELARQKGVDPQLAQDIQRCIIDAVVARHRQIAKETKQ